jgi:ABC-type glutathione transport system ATPase component
LKSTRRGVHGISRRGIIISKEDFVKYYPVFLFQILSSQEDDDEAASNEGVDICFQNLCLEVQVAKAPVNVVDNVTGRIRAKTMTALMGGSGAGK